MNRTAPLVLPIVLLLAACDHNPLQPHVKAPLDLQPGADVVAGATAGPTPIDLGTLPGGRLSVASGINAAGQVVGWSETQNPNFPVHAFLWSRTTGMRDLGTQPGGVFSLATGINASGQVVGNADVGGNHNVHAFLWSEAGGMQDLGTPFEPFESFAAGINATGQVIVNSFTAAGREHAFIWTAGNGLRDLGISNDISSHATGINAAGQVVGYVQIDPTVGQPAGQQHAFIWSQSSGMQDLGPVIGGSVSTANGINEQGELVGTVAFFTAEDAGHAFTWSQATGMRDLGPLSNGTSAYSTGVGINANGQVVGEGWAGGQSHAYRWSQATGMQDLGTLAGGTFSTATGINDAGDVVGRGDGTAGYHAILWSNRLSVDLLVFPFNPALPRVPVIYNRTMPLLSTPVVLAILGSATFPVADPVTHAARVQVSSVLLGKTPVAMFRGVYAAYGADVNGDGIPDLVLSFRTDQLVANGDLSTTITAPQSVVLTGTHADGRQFSGPAKISVVLAPWITPE